jgi:patatin-like phospholipase/acyl hydrolase
LAGIPVVNLLNVGTGSNHSFTLVNDIPITTCTNYRFKLQNKPFDLNDKCRLAIQSFEYARNYNTTKCRSVGGVYFKNILPNDIYSSQGYADGTLLLPAYFVATFSFQNSDIENSSIPLPSNINNILHNNLDIFIDSKKLNFNNQDIRGCLDDDAWSMTLVIYEIDEYDPITHELDTKLRNYINPRLF